MIKTVLSAKNPEKTRFLLSTQHLALCYISQASDAGDACENDCARRTNDATV
jgi:hypothetical protein